MNKKTFIAFMAGAGVFLTPAISHAAFSSVTKIRLVASAKTGTSGGGGSGSATDLTIAAIPLASQVFFSKNVVVGVDISNTASDAPIDTGTIKVDMFYQLMNAQGQALTDLRQAPAILLADLQNPRHMTGSVVIARSDLAPIQNGGSFNYYFQASAKPTSASTVLLKTGEKSIPAGAGSPASGADFFSASVINEISGTINPSGSQVTVPDTFQKDGATAFNFPSGAVPAPTTLTVRQMDLNSLPPGPRGLKPVVAYTVALDNGQSPQRPVQVALSYPADLDGRITGTGLDPTSLAAYSLDANQWQLLSLPQIDTTLHTVTGFASRFSTFALFPIGAVGAADLRPMQRIITPNGDGINDYAEFSNVSGDVHIYGVKGNRVRTLTGTDKRWFATDDNNRIVESGVYLYQYTDNGSRISGVIMVAK